MSRALTRMVCWSGQPYVLGETPWGEEFKTRNVVVECREGIRLRPIEEGDHGRTIAHNARRAVSNQRLPIRTLSRLRTRVTHRENRREKNAILSKDHPLRFRGVKGIREQRMLFRVMHKKYQDAPTLEFGLLIFVQKDERCTPKRKQRPKHPGISRREQVHRAWPTPLL